MLVVLFFRCMSALLNPVYRRGEQIKRGLVAYTVVMFSLATILTAMNLHILSISFIDNREFFHPEKPLHPGPYGYFEVIYYKAINIVPNASFCLNNWLADGLLVSSLFCCGHSSNTGSFSFIAVTCSTLGTSGPSHSPSSCTSALWVRI